MEDQPQQPTAPKGTDPRQPPPEATAPKESRFASATIAKVVTALARAQGKYKTLIKNCDGTVNYPARDGRPAGSYDFEYADLAAVIAATSEALSSEELAHTAIIGAGRIRVMLMHSSGEFLASDAPIPSPEEVGVQKFGTQVTYLRRYLLGPLIGVASEDDDDGNAAEGNRFAKKGNGPPDPPPPPPAQRESEKPTPIAVLLSRLTELKIEGKDAVLKWLTDNTGRKISATRELKPAEITKLQEIADKAQPTGKAA